MNDLNETVKIRDLLIYFGITLAISAFIKKISKREDGSVFLHALSLTMGWLVGKLITGYLDEEENETI